MAGVVIDALVLSSTFLLAQWIGQKLLGMDKRTTLLVGPAPPSAALPPCWPPSPWPGPRRRRGCGRGHRGGVRHHRHLSLPGAVPLECRVRLDRHQHAAVWCFVGSTVHEVAQVVAAGEAIGSQAADTAVIAKMVRVMMLAPFLLVLSMWLSRSERSVV